MADALIALSAGKGAVANATDPDHGRDSSDASTRGPSVTAAHSHNSTDEQMIASFGKKQRLKRRFKYLSGIGISLSLMVTWMVTLLTLQFGLANGGPAGLIYGFLAAWCGSFIQSLVLPEMASMIPLTGRAFNWIAILSPEWCLEFLNYLFGWLALITWYMAVAGGGYVNATLIQGVVILVYPQYEPKLSHAYMMSFSIIGFTLACNTVFDRMRRRVETFFTFVYVMVCFAVLMPLIFLGPNKPVSVSEVFGIFQDLGGWDTQGLSFFTGWLTGTATFVGLDGTDLSAEEIDRAQHVILFSMWSSVLESGILGFAILLATLFSTLDITAAVESKTGYPFMDIFISSMGSKTAYPFIVLMLIINIFSVTSVLTTVSRFYWAFARENAWPLSSFLNPETRTPINVSLVVVLIGLLSDLIGVGSAFAVGAFFSLVTACYYSVFFIAGSGVLHKRLTTPDAEIPWAPFRLGRFGTPVIVLSPIYTFLMVFWSMWPQAQPVASETMSWAPIMIVASLGVSLVFLFAH